MTTALLRQTPMVDSRPGSSADAASQRRARRPQPYTSNSAASSSRASNPALSIVVAGSSDQTSFSVAPPLFTPSSSPSSGSGSGSRDGTPTQVPHTVALQRGSACLTCRRRKLKCDANKPACTSCARTGRSQTCSYDDGLPKSRVQLLTGKVRYLEEKILAMESSRLPSPAGFVQQGPLTPLSSTNASPYVSVLPAGDGVNTLGPFSQGFDNTFDTWKSFAPGNAELIDFAATLAVPSEIILPYPQQDVLGAIKRITPWWELDEIPSGMQQHLLGIFLPRRWELGTEIDVARLWASLTDLAANQHHPCFLNAMYLIGCYFSGDKALEELEGVFISKTRKSMEASLVEGDRLIDFIRASSLLSFYYFSKGRLLEGHHLCSTTARFTIACGLHRMSSTRWQPQSEYGRIDIVEDGGLVPGQTSMLQSTDGPNLIPRPRDNIERNEYVHAFWLVYMQDLGGGLITGLPISFLDSEVTTPWPTPLNDDTYAIPSDQQTLIPLYSGIPGTADMSNDRHTEALRIKSVCLLGRAARLSAALESSRHPDDGLLFKHEACERAILECTRTLPTELEQLMGTEGKIALLVARATLLAALIQLHSSLSATRQDSRNKCMAAATDLIEMLRVLRYMQVPATILILFGVDWSVANEFYVAERGRLLAEGNLTLAETIANYIQEIDLELTSVPLRISGLTARAIIDAAPADI